MSFTDSIGDALGLGSSAPPPPPPKPATFKTAGYLDAENESAKGSMAPGALENALESGELIEFIHFGKCHLDWHLNFDHSKTSDTGFPDFTKSKYRGLSFRAGGLREALLLHGFISGTQETLREGPKGAGAVGDALALGASALGAGGSSGPKPPKPEDLDPFLDRVATAGGKLNSGSIKYLDLHKATVELHQVRAEYNAFAIERIKPDSSPGLMPTMPGIVGTVQKIATKAPDIYLQMFVTIRTKVEPVIEEACYGITLDAIRAKRTPVYPVWSPANKEAEAAAPGEGSDNLLAPVNQAIQSAMDRINTIGQDAMDFLGLKGADEAPGQSYLNSAVGGFESAGSDYAGAFTSMGVPMPGLLETLVKEVAAANLELLRGALSRLMLKPEDPISEDLLVRAGRHAITKRVMALLGSITGADSLMNPKPKEGGGVDVGSMASTAATSQVTNFLDDNVITKLDFIVETAVKDIAGRIQATQKAGGSPVTMEPFLGRMPWWLTHMTRNVVFPIWDLVVNKVLGSALGPVGGQISSAESVMGDVNSYADKASGVMDKLGGQHNVTGQDVANFAQDPSKALNSLLGGGGSAPPAPKFPGGSRTADATAEQVTQEDINGAEHKWHLAETKV